MAIVAYTDGSSLGNPGPGGFGCILLETEKKVKKEISQGFRLTTNNRMELLAVITALETLKFTNTEIHRVKFQWIKGHAGHHWNEEADKLAVAAANKPENFKIDSYFEIHQNEE